MPKPYGLRQVGPNPLKLGVGTLAALPQSSLPWEREVKTHSRSALVKVQNVINQGGVVGKRPRAMGDNTVC